MGKNEKQYSTKYENAREDLEHMGAILYSYISIYFTEHLLFTKTPYRIQESIKDSPFLQGTADQ